jgi:hypothetical protein
MGFMDRAKKLAEQAQEKLEEAQKNFNSSQPHGQQAEQGAARYDEHGRPITQEETPAAATPPPAAAPQAATEAPASSPAAEQPATADTPDTGGANASPDPFKPIQ